MQQQANENPYKKWTFFSYKLWKLNTDSFAHTF